MILSTLAVALCLAPARAEPANKPEAPFAEAPLDPDVRLRFVATLAALPGRGTEAIEALRPLLRVPAVASRTRGLLGPLLAREAPRAAYAALYAELLLDPTLPDAPAIALLAARLKVREPGTRREGLAQLRNRVLAAPGDGDAAVAYGDALMTSLDIDAAFDAYFGGKAYERAALAALALDHVAIARTFAERAGALPRPPALAQALRTPTPEARARALSDAGFPEAAALLLDARNLSPDGDLLLGGLRQREGAWDQASVFYRAALAKDPGNRDARAALGRALRQIGRLEEAAELLGADAPAIRAARLVAAARATADPVDDGLAAEQAFALYPADAVVAERVGAARFAAGQHAAAAEPLGVALEARPGEAALVAAYVPAALAAGRPWSAVEAARRALLTDATPEDRAPLVDALVNALLGAATERIRRGDPEAARLDGLAALAMRPDAPWVQRGTAGILWGLGDAEGARALYLRSLDREPGNLDARVAAANLCFWSDHRDRVAALLAGVPEDRADVRELREQIRRAGLVDAARVVSGMADPAASEQAIRGLLRKAPTEVELVLRLADAVGRQGRHAEALGLLAYARQIAPDDPWPTIAEVNERVAGGDIEGARARLDALRTDLPPAVALERDRAKARMLRAAADGEREAGRIGAAVLRYAESAALDPNPWTLAGLAGLYVQEREYAAALAVYEQLAARFADDAELSAIAERGRAGVLEALGRRTEALLTLEALAARVPSEEHLRLHDEMSLRETIARADDARREGALDEAFEILSELAVDQGESPDVHAALAAVLLDRGDASDAVDEAIRALVRDPGNRWALDTALRAAPDCACARRVLPYLAVAVAGGDASAREGLARVRTLTAVESADELRNQHRSGEALDTLAEAGALAGDDAESHMHVARGYAALHRTRLARASLRRVLAIDPRHVEAALELADTYRRALRHGAAEHVLEQSWQNTRDPRVGMELARTRAGRGRFEPALADLAAIDAGEEAPPSIAADVATLRAAIAEERIGWVAPGVGVLARSGVTGIQREFATFSPVSARIPVAPWSAVIEAVPVWVTDGLHQDTGVAFSGGLFSPAERPLAFSTRLGTSPIGFDAGFYPTWNVTLKARPARTLTLGLDSGRVPLLDSLASWAGQRDLRSGEMYGSVSNIWGGASARLSTDAGTELGLLGRAGWVDGLAMERNGRRDAVAWAARRIGSPARSVRLGLEGVLMGNDRQADAFEEGSGAYYSPETFGVALARLDGRWHGEGDRLGICASIAGGVQHSVGRDSLFFKPGTVFAHNGRVDLRTDLGSRLRLDIELTYLMAGPAWHQETALLRIGYGRAAAEPTSASPLTTFAMPGAGLVFTGDPC